MNSLPPQTARDLADRIAQRRAGLLDRLERNDMAEVPPIKVTRGDNVLRAHSGYKLVATALDYDSDAEIEQLIAGKQAILAFRASEKAVKDEREKGIDALMLVSDNVADALGRSGFAELYDAGVRAPAGPVDWNCVTEEQLEKLFPRGSLVTVSDDAMWTGRPSSAAGRTGIVNGYMHKRIGMSVTVDSVSVLPEYLTVLRHGPAA